MNAFSECKYVWRETPRCKHYETEEMPGGGYTGMKYTGACRHRVVTNIIGGKNVGILDDTLPYRILCDRCLNG